MELTFYRIEFDVDKTTRRFTILSNVEQFGLNMETIFDEWISQAGEVTALSLCSFIRSKNDEIVSITDAGYEQLYAD